MTLQHLLDHGADLEVKTRSGKTPLYWAAEGEHRESLQKLVKAGANIASPLLLLAKNEFLAVCCLGFHVLLEVGITANEEIASSTLLALRECARLGYPLCGECQRVLLQSSAGRALQQILPVKLAERPKHWR